MKNIRAIKEMILSSIVCGPAGVPFVMIVPTNELTNFRVEYFFNSYIKIRPSFR